MLALDWVWAAACQDGGLGRMYSLRVTSVRTASKATSFYESPRECT